MEQHLINSVIEQYISGATGAELVQRFSLSHSTVYRLLRDARVTRSQSDARSVFSCNDNAFSVLNDNSAYWIGFLMADGCVSEPHDCAPHIRLELSSVDRTHIEKFRNFVNTTHPIHDYPTTSDIRVKSLTMANDLARYGVVPRKTFIAKAIDIEDNRDFWRGVIDGDGCVGVYGGYPKISLCGGSETLVDQFRTYVRDITPSKSNLYKHKNCQLWNYSIAGKHAVRVLRTLYENAETYLERKYDKTMDILRVFG